MPGRPKLMAFAKRVKDEELDIFDRVMDGESIRSIMQDYDVSRGMFYLWLDLDPKRKEAYRKAREIAGHALAEDSGAVLDELHADGDFTPAEVTLAKERANWKRWYAGVQNEDYAPKRDGKVEISIGQLHLAALTKAAAAPAIEARVEEAEYELEDGGEAVAALTGGES